MTSLTERYLAATLAGIPEGQRPDVERELRSSIADAVDDRVAAGEDLPSAEKAVLESLGDPARLASGISGRPLYLIGPELFPAYKHILVMLASVAVPIVGVVQVVLELGRGGSYAGALGEGIDGAISVGVQIAFWVTLAFALLERVDSATWERTDMRELRDGLKVAKPWTVANLPDVPPSGRVGVAETVGEVVGLAISIGGLLLLRGVSSIVETGEVGVPLLQPDVVTFWSPALLAVLAALVGFEIVKFWMEGWNTPLAIAHAVLQVAFAGPVIALALTGSIINPAFANEIGWPPLAEGNGPVMLAIAGGALLATAWEIFDGFRRARRPRLEATVAM